MDHVRMSKSKETIREEYMSKKYETINFTDSNSDNIFANIKLNTFERLFGLLDSDGDGRISIFNIDLSKLPSPVQNILDPILNGLREANTSLSKEEFIGCLEQLFGFLKFEEKRILLNFNRKIKKVENKELSFKVRR